jgi:hypothetical protein
MDSSLDHQQSAAASSAVGSNTSSRYKSILDMQSQGRTSTVVGLNPNMKPTTQQSYAKIFPMYGLWREDNIFQSTK